MDGDKVLFMLNRKVSSKRGKFYELSFKGGAEKFIDDDIKSANDRELMEEMPDFEKSIFPFYDGIITHYFDALSPIEENSDILILEDNNEYFKMVNLEIIISSLRRLTKKTFPKLTEHDKTIWVPIDEAINILYEEKNDEIKNDYFLAKNLLVYIPFNNYDFFKPECDINYVGGTYIKIPEFINRVA
ncbi:hypothetical protein K9L67_03330 [Candidatus Woesearchaeota archaeon]|nr:hypothetical protein [Candidatus Woesearchaeota archaeon]MCF7901234.1 hypothetical protein [Candidatus Woesearchaeota archaeon]MCF8013763.1 hypothetical protein [Candidatus Woesearchaeota archaeon]